MRRSEVSAPTSEERSGMARTCSGQGQGQGQR
jgi:hypothetical protein